ncbi:MAG: DNA-binding protein [Lachnospiraceae bacterium]|nr:DNA-binding protein [Lachnospiraceae bacterium]
METKQVIGVEERIELTLLYDFYGALLKENQRRMFEAYMMEDYGYSEIAASEGISRQGAYDAISRATKQLRAYEEKLGLVRRFQRQQKQVEELRKRIDALALPEDTPGLPEILQLLKDLIQEDLV